jgi:hypothetical protein
MTNPKETLLKIKELFSKKFDAPVPPTPPVDTTAPADTTTTPPVMFSWAIDGGNPVYVNCADDGMEDIDSGDSVYADEAMSAPYPDGDYKVTGTDFGFTVSGGDVTSVTDPDAKGPGPSIESGAAATQPDQTMTTAPTIPNTPEAMRALYASFATGTPEDRLTNLELVAKALMEYSFGWQIQEAERVKSTADAINIYKQDLATTQAKLEKQDEVIKGLFELAEKLVEEPTAEPVTLTGVKKEKFDRSAKREEKFQSVLEALKEAKNNKK